MIEGIAKLPNIVTLDVGEYQGSLVDLMENFTTTVVRCIVKIVGRYSLCTCPIYEANGFKLLPILHSLLTESMCMRCPCRFA